MLAKWHKNKPTRFTDYVTTPSRFDLVSLLMGNYNACWDYQQVADAVASRYANTEQHLRAEMVTAQLVAHRRTRMLTGFDGFDTRSLVRDLLDGIAQSGVTPKGNTYHFRYNWAEGRAEPVWSA